jgi:hypothetical protein
MHLPPLIAVLERGAGAHDSINFEEANDFDFWDRHFRVFDDEAKPYLMPLTLLPSVKTYPHGNPATMRKNRWDRWGLGKSSVAEGKTLWSLDPNYAAVFRKKALTKGGHVNPVPVVDLAAVLLRNEEFPDDATARTLEDRFRDRFPQRPADYETIFVFRDESWDSLYTDASPSAEDYAAAMRSAVLEEADPQEIKVAPATAGSLDDDDPILVRVKELLALGSSGVIFRGAPGTGKTWYARRIAERLVEDPAKHIVRVQFHPSYGYEDFVEGFRPDSTQTAGFSVVDKHFLDACRMAEETTGYAVLLIDEINRGDPARVFGEVLTYIEKDYREQEFRLPYSPTPRKIPANLLIFGTMNPFDRSISQLDSAFMRRFDHIDIEPNGEVVARFLDDTGLFSPAQTDRVRTWFDAMQQILTPYGIGHSYFKDVRRIEDLALVWRYRMQPACNLLLEFNQSQQVQAARSFDGMLADLLGMESPVTGEIEADEA